jgi:YHS domain-containing protein
MIRFPAPLLTAASLAAAAALLTPVSARAIVPGSTAAVNTDADHLAMHGYDAVAYFTAGAPTKGDSRYSTTFGGARYQFASADNLKRFEANPAAYAPQFGGFCAMGASFGEKVEVDPAAWQIVGGKLYLNNSPKVLARWREDVPGNIARADQQWPKIEHNPQ